MFGRLTGRGRKDPPPERQQQPATPAPPKAPVRPAAGPPPQARPTPVTASTTPKSTEPSLAKSQDGEGRRSFFDPPQTTRALKPVPVAATPATVARKATEREPTSDDLDKITRFSGRVLTAEGGRMELPQGQRQFVAVLDDGTMLVAKSHAYSSQVSSARHIMQRTKFQPTSVLLVDMELIRQIQEADTRRTSGGGHARETVQMQRMVIDLIRAAATAKCSDIHITVGRQVAQIRVRSDGVMANLRDLPSANATDLCQAAFNMADASDAAYKPLEYQGARITSLKTTLPEGVQAVRLQFNPLPDHGRYLVMRLLYAQKVRTGEDVDQLGYTQDQIRQFKRMRRKPSGINVISGPTGSGKSTTLQRSLSAALRDCNHEKNVITVEDPPEYEIEGAAQLPVVNVKTEEERREAFRQAITASLRSDPDIVMIGEIRDGASAKLAFQASMTGHQVWASLHANDALSILDRLRDMDVELYRLSDYTLVTGLIGQRLVRKLCSHCRVDLDSALKEGLVEDEFVQVVVALVGREEARSKVKFANPSGCQHCRAGYQGRTVVAEVILPDRKFMDHIAKEEKIQAYEYWLDKLDGVTMLENAMLRVMRGEVDPREVEDKVGLIDEIDKKRFPSLQGTEVPRIAHVR